MIPLIKYEILKVDQLSWLQAANKTAFTIWFGFLRSIDEGGGDIYIHLDFQLAFLGIARLCDASKFI